MSENAVARQIVDAAYRVHTTLGTGLLESVYEAALAYELEKRRLRLTRQQAIPVVYETVHILITRIATDSKNDLTPRRPRPPRETLPSP